MKLMGYLRENGKFGIRNHILVIPTSVCASETATRIAALVPGAVAIPNQHGCCQIGSDLDLTEQILIGFGKNPNVAAVLVVGLGCDGIKQNMSLSQLQIQEKKLIMLLFKKMEEH